MQLSARRYATASSQYLSRHVLHVDHGDQRNDHRALKLVVIESLFSFIKVEVTFSFSSSSLLSPSIPFNNRHHVAPTSHGLTSNGEGFRLIQHEQLGSVVERAPFLATDQDDEHARPLKG